MVDWGTVDWVLIGNIAGSTWGITVLVAAIAWLAAYVAGLFVRKVIRPKLESKKAPEKGE
jgi:hypothetical protein